MFYTLLKFLGWGVLLAFIGGCIGWALRALKSRSEVALASAATIDSDEMERMRHRLANLEQVVAERDRLRIQLADVRHADSPGIVGAEVPASSTSAPESEEELEPEQPSAVALESQPHEDAPDQSADGEPSHAPDSDVAHQNGATGDDFGEVAGPVDVASDDEFPTDEPATVVALDLDAAATELGKKIELDDLTVVDGIGPKISELCSGIGVTTWRQLADSDIAVLQSMLNDAGSRYTVHKPGTWPRQAELLATGQWAAFVAFTDELHAGK